MEEVEQICTRILIMDKGKSLAVGTNEELKKMIKNTETIEIEAAAASTLSEILIDFLIFNVNINFAAKIRH